MWIPARKSTTLLVTGNANGHVGPEALAVVSSSLPYLAGGIAIPIMPYVVGREIESIECCVVESLSLGARLPGNNHVATLYKLELLLTRYVPIDSRAKTGTQLAGSRYMYEVLFALDLELSTGTPILGRKVQARQFLDPGAAPCGPLGPSSYSGGLRLPKRLHNDIIAKKAAIANPNVQLLPFLAYTIQSTLEGIQVTMFRFVRNAPFCPE